MTLTLTKNRKRRAFPSLMDGFFDGNLFNSPSLLDFNSRFFKDEEFPLVPDANVIENEKDFQLELAVPGLERKDFNIEVKENLLSISAEKKEENKKEEKNYRSREFSYSSFYRSFNLPKNLVIDKIDAKYENGVLKITLPKAEIAVSKPVKQIKVE
ncbi:MAG TPA: Hsp20/alpha crystallin family protein [Flavobacterium sp.]|jgi:HSP20 family protein|nr:Hsp20/alpha crystallin family protein [Flavobacterium sp.]